MDARKQRFGNPGTLARPSSAWRHDKLMTVRLPWPMVNVYNGQTISSIVFHRDCADHLVAALTAVYDDAVRMIRLTPEWETYRRALKDQWGFQRSTAFYDEKQADWTQEQALALIASFGGNLFGGSYCHRTMRGSEVLSSHAFGIALDIDPAHNPMGKPLRTRFPAWFIQCFIKNGFAWGGNWTTRPDAMHFEHTT